MIAQSKNFSEFDHGDGHPFDFGDNNKAVEEMESQVQADLSLLILLKKMDDRQKIILMFQFLREAGHNFNHADCATVIGITRERYMVLLKEVKKRAVKILQTPLL